MNLYIFHVHLHDLNTIVTFHEPSLKSRAMTTHVMNAMNMTMNLTSDSEWCPTDD
jgi:hypothetical protein